MRSELIPPAYQSTTASAVQQIADITKSLGLGKKDMNTKIGPLMLFALA